MGALDFVDLLGDIGICTSAPDLLRTVTVTTVVCIQSCCAPPFTVGALDFVDLFRVIGICTSRSDLLGAMTVYTEVRV